MFGKCSEFFGRWSELFGRYRKPFGIGRGGVENLLGGVEHLSEGARKDIELFGRWREIFSHNEPNFSAGARKGVESVGGVENLLGCVKNLSGCRKPCRGCPKRYRTVGEVDVTRTPISLSFSFILSFHPTSPIFSRSALLRFRFANTSSTPLLIGPRLYRSHSDMTRIVGRTLVRDMRSFSYWTIDIFLIVFIIHH
jgi:hypothetical protein